MKQKLSYYLLLLLGLLSVTGMRAQTLAAGDIAFIGYNTSGSDGFSFIALKDLPAGETLYFTEEGWSATGWNNEFEPHLSWVIPAGTTIGTVVSVIETAPNTFTVTGSSNGVTQLNPTGSAVNFNLLGGDQILAYQSTSGARPASPTFISGVHGDYNSINYNVITTWNDNMPLNGGSESIVPTGLTNGLNCISLYPAPGPEQGYNKYTGTLTGTASTVRTAINNPANWTNSGTTDLGILPSNYSGINITPDAPACSLTVYNVTGGGSFCQGGSGVFIGLADSDVGVSYQLYLGANPSGSPVTGTGNNISFGTRTTAGTYTVVASDGGSCQENMNGSASITVNPLPTITLGTSPTVPQGSTSANLPYSATTNSPVTYTITWSATALGAGFTNISTPQPLPASPVVITVPAGAPLNTYVAAIRVQNANCNSTSTIFTVTVANPNSAPTFVGGATQALSLCENSTAVSINNLLQVNDTNNGQTLTWSVTSAASNGTVAASYSTSSNGGQVTPIGLTYTPNANYTGNDSFTVQVFDGFATASTTVNVTVTGVDASISSQTNIACNGGATGALTVAATNGAAPYTYLWSNGATTASINGLAAGTYSVTVTDANSCTATASATLTEPTTALSGTTVVTNIACNGGNTGAINLTPTGGTAPYTFDWGGGITTEDRTGLTAGTYSVTITDANGCTGTVSATITEPTAAVSGTTVVTNVACNGGNTGAINLTPTGGTGPYTFDWGGGITTEDRTGLSAGTYSVTITDANGCTGTVSATVTEPTSAVSGTTVVTNVACLGGNTGAINLTPTGGTSPYTFDWGGGITTEDRTGLSAGTYSVTITDANGCTGTASATVIEPTTAVSGTTVVTNVACNGGNTGAINLTPTGGTAPYTFDWGVGVTTEDRTGLSAGTYSVTITDANGCTATASVTVTEPAVLSASAVVDNNATCADNDGAATVSVTGGTAGYTYLWSNGAVTASVTGLSAGTYTVTVTDANGCTATDSVTITTPPAPSVSVTSQVNVACNGDSNGSADITVTGGTAPYTFVWSNSAVTEDVNSLMAGTYTVTVTDAGGCTATASVTITEPTVLSAAGVATNVSCNGGSNGAVDLTVTGGTGTYTYLWSNNATTEDLTGLAAGTYDVTVTDANGCTATASVEITEPTILSASGVATNVSCNGGSNGTADLTVTGGTAPYTYLWSNAATTEDLTGLMAGTYDVTVTDANGCTATASVTITEPALLEVSTVVDTNVSCNSGTTGSVTINVTGGTSPFDYVINGTTWSGVSSATLPITGLSAGTYPVTVTDNNGCTATGSVTITQPAAIAASGVVTNVSCNGGNNGAINLTVTGGTGAYTYLWSNSAVTEDLTDLSAGIYSVTVTDANGCTGTASVTVTEPTVLSAAGVATNVSCNGGSNGTVDLTVTGGTGTYTYLWSNNATTEDLTGLMAGTYDVTVTDANGCTATASVTVTEPTVLSASATATNVSCNGGNNGTANLTVTGGTGTYTYLWSNNATTEDLTGLAAGTYSVTVTDANGCTATASVTITEPTVLSASASVTNVSCNGGNNGTADLTVTGGTGTYTYLWSNGATTQDLTGLMAGTYSVTVTDANGCTATASVTITQPTAISATATATNVSCNGGTNGTATVSATGGTGAYTYSWTGTEMVATPFVFQGFEATGSWNYTFTPAIYNISNDVWAIVENVGSIATASEGSFFFGIRDLDNPNGGGNFDHTITFDPIDVSAQGAMRLSFDYYSVEFEAADVLGYVVELDNGTTWGPTVELNRNTGAWTTVNIDIPASANFVRLRLIAKQDGASDFAGFDNVVLSTLSGPQTASISGLAAGTYGVTVTDANGCTATASVTVTEPAVLSASAVATNVSCNGGNNGAADLTVTGGTSPYTYLWSNSATTQDLTGLAAGTYNVTVTDANGCTATASVTLTQPTALVATAASQVNVLCNGAATGSATVSATGGTGTYTYSWAPSGGTAATATGLMAGTYTVTVTDANGCTATQSFTITQPAALVATAASQVNILCNGGTNGSATVTVAGGVSPYTYAWDNGATGATATDLAAGTYVVTVTDANNCTTTQSFTITQPDALVATAASQVNVLCNGAETGSATVGVTGGVSPYTYAWDNGATGATATDLAAGTYVVTVTDANSCTTTQSFTISEPDALAATTSVDTPVSCFGGNEGVATVAVTGGVTPYTYLWSNNATTATITGLTAGTYDVTVTDANGCTTTASVTVTEPAEVMPPAADAQVFCNFGTVAELEATGTDVQWYDVATGGSPLAGTASLTTATYYATQTVDGCESPTRTAVAVTVNITPAPTANAQTFCNSATVADLTSSGTDVQWYTAATGGTALADDTALATGTYYVSQTLNECESTRAAVSITVNVTPAPTATTQTFCNSATVAELTATGTDIKWYATETGGTELLDTAALATGTYYASQTLNNCEGPRAAVSVIVNVTPAPAAVAQTFCNAATVADLEAEGTGTILWYADATGGTALADATALANGTTYYASQTLNGCESTTRTAVAVTINVTTAPTADAQVFCSGATVADLSATGTAIMWYANATGGTALADDTALATGTYYATQTIDGCESATRTAVTVTVNVTPAPTADAQVFCNSATVADLSATGDNLLWYVDATGGSALADDTALATGTYYVSQTLNECEGPRTAVAVTVNVTPAPVAEAQTFCDSATVADLTATGDNLAWYADATGGTALTDDTALATGTYYVSQTLNNCEGPRTAVAVTIQVTEAPVATDLTLCEGATVADLTAEGTDILWYADETGGEPLAGDDVLVSGTTYYASQTVNGCESATRTAVAVTITVTPAPTGEAAQVVGENATFANLTVEGTDIVWYANAEDAANHVNPLDPATILEDGVIYYATQTLDGCESVASLAVTVTVSLRTDSFERNKLSYYPVPVVDVLTIENNNMINRVTVIDLLGQVVITQDVNATTAKVDMRSLQGATYIVQIETEYGIETVKVVRNSNNN